MAQVLSMVVQATIPGIGGYLGSGAREKAAALRGEVVALVWVLGTGIGVTIVMWNHTFVSLWVGENLYAGDTVTLLLVVLAFQLALIRADAFIIDVALVPRVKVVAGLVAAIVSISLGALAAGPLGGGPVGLCLGPGRGTVRPRPDRSVAVGRFLGIPLHRQVLAVLRPGLASLILFAVAVELAPAVPQDLVADPGRRRRPHRHRHHCAGPGRRDVPTPAQPADRPRPRGRRQGACLMTTYAHHDRPGRDRAGQVPRRPGDRWLAWSPRSTC